jgi:flagellar hook-associated protein 1 FlgK
MSDMMNIARSGVLASRTALAITAENVANVNTEGYRRRSVATVTAAGAQTTPQTLPTGGQGVSVTEIRRAFDHLLAERGRTAASAQASAMAHQAVAERIETQLIPGETGLDGTMRGFFDGLARLAASPADMTTRTQALRGAQALADGIAEIADGFLQLRAETVAQAELSAARAQGLLADLHQVSQQIGQLGARQTEGHHPLADRRDALLADLARELPIAVSLGEDGRPEIRLGSDAGPLLLDRAGPARLSITAPDQVTLHITAPDGSQRETRLLSAGRLGGLAMGVGAIDMARQEFDQLARNLAEGLNQLHRAGVDIDGQPGQDLFRLDGWTATPAATNAGQVQVQIRLGDTQAAQGPLEIVFDASLAEWQARDSDGTLLASGRDRLLLPGLTVDLAGPARDGDRVVLAPVTGRALDLRVALSDPRMLAASAEITVAPAPGTSGSARLEFGRPAGSPAPPPLDFVVTDPATGEVALQTVPDGAVLATATLGADGRVSMMGLDFQLVGAAQAGDRFTLRPTGAASGNGDVAQAMAGQRRGEGGALGMLDQLARVQGDLGTRTAAAQRAHATAQARLESAERDEAALGGVNLDVEAARMAQLQQSYQASAQALSIARSLFETLLRMI